MSFIGCQPPRKHIYWTKKILHFNIQNHIHHKATIILFQICSCQLVLIKLSATHRNQNSPQNCLNRTSLIITLQNSRMQIWVLHLLEFHALQLPSHLKMNRDNKNMHNNYIFLFYNCNLTFWHTYTDTLASRQIANPLWFPSAPAYLVLGHIPVIWISKISTVPSHVLWHSTCSKRTSIK